MGYEVTYHYHEEVEKGVYDREETHSQSIKVGKPFEDVPLDVLAGKVMALFARRNILVVDVEIHELVRKKLSFKEAADGILIKNRKFRFDDGSNVQGEDVVDVADQLEKLMENPQVMQMLAQKLGAQPHEIGRANPVAASTPVQPHQPSQDRPVRYEVYDPDLKDEFWMDEANKMAPNGLKFTVGQKYPIFEEKGHPGGTHMGMVYTTKDDDGNKIRMTATVFRPPSGRLIAGSQQDEELMNSLTGGTGSGGGLMDDGLNWGSATTEQMPAIR